jgi:hypothetical protein
MRDALGLMGSTIVLATLGLLIWLMLTATPISDLVAHVVAFALHGLRSFAGAVAEGARRGVERASGWRKQRATVERKALRAAPAANEDDPPVVFGQDLSVDRKRAESIIEISTPASQVRAQVEEGRGEGARRVRLRSRLRGLPASAGTLSRQARRHDRLRRREDARGAIESPRAEARHV